MALIVLFSGCAGLSEDHQPLRISVSDLRVTSATLFEQNYLVKFQLQNPNPTDVPLAGLGSAQLEVEASAPCSPFFASSTSCRREMP